LSAVQNESPNSSCCPFTKNTCSKECPLSFPYPNRVAVCAFTAIAMLLYNIEARLNDIKNNIR